jgi:phosphotransferase system  glucose/maltose/N-acetylglucosamine-specific IIC component
MILTKHGDIWFGLIITNCNFVTFVPILFIVLLSLFLFLIKRIVVIGINSFYGTVITWGKSEEF